MKKNYKYLFYDTLSSTNTYCKEQFDSLDDLTVVQALNQTNGRGRSGHTWDASGDSVSVSLLIKNSVGIVFDEKFLNAITLITSCAVNKVLRKTGFDILIKWPNDQVYLDKKLCGILVEAITCDNLVQGVIIGIGINLNQDNFDTPYPATSLKILTHEIKDPKIYAHLIMTELLNEIDKYVSGDNSYIEYNNIYSSLKNRYVSYYKNNQKYFGYVKGLNEFGELLIDDEIIKFGEVMLVRKEEGHG